ncbi:hypothetical protein [Luteimicrobium subarcticum]|uniref:hypothetical protein n=1 Tax=Luteimicrobium subarcticum TaxID=620910 RepID=UPI000C24996A|nr:hypothetical protein [Luteimicrobium subarcticum]
MDPDVDPFVEDDVLQEAQVLDARVDAVSSIAAILLDLRTALQFEVGNFAMLVVHGVRSAEWQTEQPPKPPTAWTVVSSRTTRPSGLVHFHLGMWPDAQWASEGASATFFVFDVPGIADTPPDYGSDGPTVVRAGLPHWSSTVEVIQETFLPAI